MITINAKVKERLTKGIKKFQPILAKAKSADINESDTVTIIADMLCDVFGYDKYEHITSEYAVKKTFCDLAIKMNGRTPLLLECKAIGLDLKDDHMRQATNYAADSGIEWAVLTNGSEWRVYRVLFTKPIERELVYSFDIGQINTKKQSDLELLYYLCIEAFQKSNLGALEDLHTQKQIFNRHIIGNIMLSEPAVESLRKVIRKLYPEIKTTNEELADLIKNEIFKREITDGEQAEDAAKKVAKIIKSQASAKPKKPQSTSEHS